MSSEVTQMHNLAGSAAEPATHATDARNTKEREGRIACLDGLRAFACSAVVLLHCYIYSGEPQWRIPLGRFAPNPMRVFQFGNTGVHLFLILSGFCLFIGIARPGREGTLKVRQFLERRFFRIVPAYYATMLFCLAMFPVYGWVAGRTGVHVEPPGQMPGAASWILHLMLLHPLLPSATFDLNGPFWSLGLEWEYYLVFPALVWGFARFGPWKTLAVLLAITLGYRAVALLALGKDHSFITQWSVISASIPGRVAEFGLGMVAAWQLARGRLRVWGLGKIVGVAIVALAAMVGGMKAAPFTVFGDLLWSMFYLAILMATLAGVPAMTRFFSLAPLTWVGERSYSVYLIHLPLLTLVAPFFAARFSGLALFGALVGVMFPITLLLATAWYHVFERPFLKGMPGRKKRASNSVLPAPVVAVSNNS